jgi:uncharacterized protein (UPF0248 family)
MSGRFTPTSESSAADRETDIPGASIGTFAINVLCNSPKFNEDVLVIVDEEQGIENATAEFEKTIIYLARNADPYLYTGSFIPYIKLFIPDNDGNGSIIVSLRQLIHMIWCLPRTPGIIKPGFFSRPNSNRIEVTIKKVHSFHFVIFALQNI